MDKMALITGATAGIGKETARGLVRAGFHVVLVARNRDKAEAVRAELAAEADGARVDVILADLSRPGEARRAAGEYRGRFDRLDVLVNNAGAYFAARELTPDGLERTFALNHLGYFVLTTELLELLKRSAPARIVNMSSGAHHAGRIDFDDLDYERRWWRGGWGAYSQSKLANILFTRELARQLDGTGVTVNSVHPGFVASDFAHNNRGWWGGLVRLGQIVARSAARGAETCIYLATSPEVATVSGQYFYDLKPRRPSRFALDDAAAARLWELSRERTRLL